MESQKMKLVVLVVFLAVCVGTCYGDLTDANTPTGSILKEAAAPATDTIAPAVNAASDAVSPTLSAVKDATAPTVDAATEKSESFAQWAYDKITGH